MNHGRNGQCPTFWATSACGPRHGRRKLSVHPEESAVVRWLFQVYTTESIGLKELANRLRQRGIPTRKCPLWMFTTIRRILTNDVYIGRLVYNRRRFKLNKATGRRIPVFRDPSEHLVIKDESLRIIDDAVFGEAARRLAERGRPERVGSLRAQAHRPFTGLIYCEACGSVCYHRLSKNRKGEYHYFHCGCRQRIGNDACSNAAVVREDHLMRDITRAYQRLFDDTDSLIQAVLREARKLADANRGQMQRVKGQLADIDRRIGPLTRLLTDPDIDPGAKKTISRQVGELEAERERLMKVVADLAERANDNADHLAKAVRQALAEARQSLANAATPAELRNFVETYVGPMVLKTDGTVAKKEPTPEDAGVGVRGSIAGGGFEHPSKSSGKTEVQPLSGTESGTLGPENPSEPPANTPPADPRLADVILAWDALPEPTKAAVLAVVRAGQGGT